MKTNISDQSPKTNRADGHDAPRSGFCMAIRFAENAKFAFLYFE
jgi:hypothetical protein